MTHLRYPTSPAFPSQPLNWLDGEKSLQTLQYAKATDEIVRPLLNKDFHSIEEIDYEIKQVCQAIVNAAENLANSQKEAKTQDTYQG